jgi:hypothetical protein
MPVSLLVALALAAVPAAAVPAAPSAPSAAAREWPGFGFDRVDVISETSTWLAYDAVMFRSEIAKPALRFVEQVRVSFRLPWRGFYAGISIAEQDLTYEYSLDFAGLYLTGGIQTRLLFPSGAHLGVAWRWKMLRVGVSLAAFTSGSWTAPGSFAVLPLPTLGIGIGPGL